MNDDGKTRDLAKDFDCAPTHNIFARSVFNFLFCNNEIVNYLITDESSKDMGHATNRVPFSSEKDLQKIEKLKGKKIELNGYFYIRKCHQYFL
jgi:hypothetical protein